MRASLALVEDYSWPVAVTLIWGRTDNGYRVGATGRSYRPRAGECCPLFQHSEQRGGWIAHWLSGFNTGMVVWHVSAPHDGAFVEVARTNWSYAIPANGVPDRMALIEEWNKRDVEQDAESERLRIDLFREQHYCTKPELLADLKRLGCKPIKGAGDLAWWGWLHDSGRRVRIHKPRGARYWYVHVEDAGHNLTTRAEVAAALT